MKKLLIFLLLLLPSSALAATVGPSGGYDYTGSTGIVDCLNAQSGGGTCEVYNGTYGGGTITASGADLDNFIIAKAAAGQTSITITSGFTFGTQDYIRIGEVGSGFDIQSGSFSCSPGGSYIQIVGNDLQTNGEVAGGMECHDWMLDANTIDGTQLSRDYEDVYVMNQAYDISDVYNVVLRNNVMGGWASRSDQGDHVDFFQDGCWAGNDHGYVMIEGNIFYNISGSDQHFQLANCINSDSSYWIIRYNIASVVANGFATSGPGSGTASYSNWVVYNNVIYGAGNGNLYWSYNNQVSGTVGAENNIVYDAMALTNIYGTQEAGSCDGNLYYDPDGTMSISGSGCYSNSSGVLGNTDPDFADADPTTSLDYSLSEDSPARDTGYPLTTTDGSGSSSTTITIDDPIYFQDGWAGINPDHIAVGTVTNTAGIVRDSINYTTGAMTLDTAITWSNGASVWLKRKSDGVDVLIGSAPDIGAVEYSGVDTTAPTTSGHNPADSATGILESTNIIVHVTDAGDGVDSGTIIMTVEGVGVSPSISGTQADYTLTYNPPVDFSYDQVINVTVDADDNASNSMTQDVYSFTIRSEPDTTNPVCTITSPADDPHDNANDETANLAGTASDANGIDSVGWTCTTCTPTSGAASGTTSWTISDITLAEGNNTFTVTALDPTSNQGVDTIVISYSGPTPAAELSRTSGIGGAVGNGSSN